ncbi:MAG: hypothetical protein WBR18_05045 [Anaerolineales bacterium]
MGDPSSNWLGGGNPLAGTSLALGVVSVALVFGIGLCALAGAQQGWLRVAATPLYICGASSAFLGLLAAVLGAASVLGKRSKGVAIAGLALGASGICLFLVIVRAVAGG